MKKVELPLDEIKDKYEMGFSCEKIARDYGVSGVTIKNQLKQAGIYKSNRNFTSAIIKDIRRAQDKLENIESIDEEDRNNIKETIQELINTLDSIE